MSIRNNLEVKNNLDCENDIYRFDFLQPPFYYPHLMKINDIKFTPREIDVIACILSGRSSGKTAIFLSIEEKTVETHRGNIMRKLECNSKDSIIDFMEGSEQYSILREHYLSLLIYAVFKKYLQNIKKMSENNNLFCSLIYWQNERTTFSIGCLEKHLKLTGVNLITIVKKEFNASALFVQEYKLREMDYIIYLIPELFIKKFQQDSFLQNLEIEKFEMFDEIKKKILLLLNRKNDHVNIPNIIQQFNCIDFLRQENYYFNTFEILKNLFSKINFQQIVLEFKILLCHHSYHTVSLKSKIDDQAYLGVKDKPPCMGKEPQKKSADDRVSEAVYLPFSLLSPKLSILVEDFLDSSNFNIFLDLDFLESSDSNIFFDLRSLR